MSAIRVRRASLLLTAGVCLLVSTACGSGSSGTSTSSTSTSSTTGSGTTPTTVNNTQAVQVGVGPTGTDVNQLLTTITICVPGTTNCQAISNILVDTGSTGLRLLSSAVTLTLPRASDSSGHALGNCVAFANNNYAWGPVATADIQIAGEVASSVPIQLLGVSGFPAVPKACDTGGSAASSVDVLGAYGILGIGVFRQDCGSACVTAGSTLPSVYFGCPSSGCVAEAVALTQQLQNPVWMFPQDNNGVLIALPALYGSGEQSVSGSLIFGIGTQIDNALSGVTIYTTDTSGNFTVTFNGANYTDSFIDSGSNGYFFLNATTLGIPLCTAQTTFYCPSATYSAGALTSGTNSASNAIALTVANAEQLFATGNNAFNDLGGPAAGGFDLGLPFFYGRYVYVAIEDQSTTSGIGPYWAY
jgi:hypothetical protein